jgi:hypothetical protein
VTERLRLAVLAAYQRLFGLELKQLVHLLSRLAPATEPADLAWTQAANDVRITPPRSHRANMRRS